ncbi:phosphatidylglycerophosphatase A [Achromobacter sp. GG226]|uniref:phosphatidylglycerophosphatase A family protein n=1 Tax=Verticiella alkaliphila TaxID=2779529 RepID=UPI001C0B0C2C|nr:phosphatidylglycerophosphatase A [Verticiella sp. GG226]MBU4611024.1 phosphatidylglycerophosphatase A [Verticiella sp. GG226]
MSPVPPRTSRSIQPLAVRPTGTWMVQRLARIVAFGFGSGLLRPAPGTWGTLAGWGLWVLLLAHLPSWGVAAVLVLGFAYGCWACGVVGRDLGVPDHGGMVWDEIIAFWLVLWLVPGDLFSQALAFVLFRAFDVVKPAPIRYFDRRFKSGFGVMIDDVIAAMYALIVFGVIAWLAG